MLFSLITKYNCLDKSEFEGIHQAEQLAIKYVFYELDIPVLYADTVLTNTRSQHVLEKVGFQFIDEDEKRKHYRIMRDEKFPI